MEAVSGLAAQAGVPRRRDRAGARWGHVLGAVLPPLPVFIALGWALHPSPTAPGQATAEPDLAIALTTALANDGLVAKPIDVHFVDPPSGAITSRVARPRAVVLAHKRNEPADVYVVKVKLSPEGRILDLSSIHNISDTSAVDEVGLEVADSRAAWRIGDAGKTYIVQFADLRGEELPTTGKWTRSKRLQERLSNLQKTGSLDGVRRRTFKLDPAAEEVALGFTDSAFLIDADGRDIQISTEGDEIVGERFLREQTHHRSSPGNLVTWAVDRVRQSPWFSDDQMQYVKMVGFWGLDVVNRFVGTVTGDDGADEIQEEFGELIAAKPVEYTDPETGWPPSPMKPILKNPLEDEGKWRLLDKDPYIRTNPGAPAPFAMSYVRTDRKRPYTRVYVVLWDPRQVELHTMSGTIEPKSATGETGPGMVPRKPEVLERLVAGFNGGFQASHGEWGMMAEGVEYLPPKPYAATVARLADGTTAFGTWPKDPKIPPEVVGYRQNMTPILQDGKFNPYKRNWWGGVPPGWKDESRTVRSAICLTKEKFVGYFYGAGIDFEHLTMAVKQARCDYAVHLDMNPGHTGLEFYKSAPAGTLPDLGRRLDPKWEAKGKVVDLPEWEFIGRRMVKFMGLMNFPRYIDREARDFFYLTLRHVLPGQRMKVGDHAEAGEGEWKVNGLPQHGWPYSVATTELRPDPKRPDTKVRMLAMDPKTVAAAKASADENTVVVVQPPLDDGPSSLWLSSPRASVAVDPPDTQSVRLARGWTEAPEQPVVAAIGIGQRDGMIYYAEITTAPKPDEDAELLGELLEQRGCRHRLLLTRSLEPALGGDRDLSGHPVSVKGGLRVVRTEAIGARRIFEDTPVVDPMVWYPLQSKRIRYFRKKKPKEATTEDGSEPASAAPAETPPAAPGE